MNITLILFQIGAFYIKKPINWQFLLQPSEIDLKRPVLLCGTLELLIKNGTGLSSMGLGLFIVVVVNLIFTRNIDHDKSHA